MLKYYFILWCDPAYSVMDTGPPIHHLPSVLTLLTRSIKVFSRQRYNLSHSHSPSSSFLHILSNLFTSPSFLIQARVFECELGWARVRVRVCVWECVCMFVLKGAKERWKNNEFGHKIETIRNAAFQGDWFKINYPRNNKNKNKNNTNTTTTNNNNSTNNNYNYKNSNED